jgi:hypothetical protein
VAEILRQSLAEENASESVDRGFDSVRVATSYKNFFIASHLKEPNPDLCTHVKFTLCTNFRGKLIYRIDPRSPFASRLLRLGRQLVRQHLDVRLQRYLLDNTAAPFKINLSKQFDQFDRFLVWRTGQSSQSSCLRK